MQNTLLDLEKLKERKEENERHKAENVYCSVTQWQYIYNMSL